MVTRTADGGRPRETTMADILAAFEARDDLGEPLTAGEVGDYADCSRRTAFDRLEELADAGRVATKKTGARGRVWWVPIPAEEADALLDGNSDVST